MSFISSYIWWTFFIMGALSYLVSSFGHHSRGLKSSQIEAAGSVGMVVFVVLSFIFSGWRSGITIIIALFLWILITEGILWLVFRKILPGASDLDYYHFIKRSLFHREPSSIPTSYKELLEHGENTDKMLLKISKRPEIIKVLQRYRKKPEDIKDVYYNLLRGGAGEYVTQSVIEDTKLLSEYLQMKDDSISDLEIVYRLSESLGGM